MSEAADLQATCFVINDKFHAFNGLWGLLIDRFHFWEYYSKQV